MRMLRVVPAPSFQWVQNYFAEKSLRGKITDTFAEADEHSRNFDVNEWEKARCLVNGMTVYVARGTDLIESGNDTDWPLREEEISCATAKGPFRAEV